MLKERFRMLLFCPKGEEGEGRRVWLTQADRVLYHCCRHRCCLLLQAVEGLPFWYVHWECCLLDCEV